MLRAFIARFIGYRVRIQWDARTITHRAGSFADALSWVRCYPADAAARITYRGRIVAIRGAR